jgi:hypothetical protein
MNIDELMDYLQIPDNEKEHLKNIITISTDNFFSQQKVKKEKDKENDKEDDKVK